MPKFYFICTENRKAPATVIDTDWEAAEMRRHPFYEEVNAAGEVVARPADSLKTEIPFSPGNTVPAEKRAVLKMPNRKVA